MPVLPEPARGGRWSSQQGAAAGVERQQGGAAGIAAGAFDRMWADLAGIGRHPATGGYRRYAWTRDDADLREWFAGEAAARGLDLVADRAGNLWAWWGDPDRALADGTGLGVVLGSHLDSVPDGGAFDGPLGVVSALAAVDALRARGVTPARPLGVAVFGDEEGARFGVACAGSRLLTGALSPDRARSLTDGDGLSMAEALRRAGHDPAALGRDDETLRRVGAFVELHVEQGRALGPLDRPVAVGTAIWPHGRWRIELPGEANHAGTTALGDRRDPMVALASVVLAARGAAAGHDALATCGKVAVAPNGVNAVPSRVTAWLDARAPEAAAVRAVVAEVAGVVEVNGGTLAEESWTDRTAFDGALAARLAGLLGGVPQLATGAGHDAGILAAAGVPTAMLFVRNPTGVSHSPAEHAERADCLAGVVALTEVAAELAGVRAERSP
ncbi:MAG: beta-ureidopropionase / N-carbamoyl-L-amino-acid hydrolase [Pseudonocardiales bacterium]|nr:beta-ureidopropionase / N-carbamoyl-L-amino-acid hydrolase [Pseudonocardiales bacterium]